MSFKGDRYRIRDRQPLDRWAKTISLGFWKGRYNLTQILVKIIKLSKNWNIKREIRGGAWEEFKKGKRAKIFCGLEKFLTAFQPIEVQPLKPYLSRWGLNLKRTYLKKFSIQSQTKSDLS